MRTAQKLALFGGILSLGIVQTSLASVSIAFTDLDPKAWYMRAVTQLADMRIVSGYRDKYGKELGLFKPDGNVTVAEMLKMGFLASKKPVPDAGVPSNISAQGDWSSPYVVAAEQLQLPLLLDNLLDVHRFATRGEVVQTLLGIFNVRLHPARDDFFRDVPLSSPYASAITTATDIGVTKGDTNANGSPLFTFRPDANINRAEVAVILSKLIAYNPATDVIAETPVSSMPSVIPSSESSESSASSASVAAPITETTPPSFAGDHRLIVTSANLRSGAGMEYRSLRYVKFEEMFTLLAIEGAWAKIAFADGSQGYVIATSISPNKGAAPQPAPTPAPAPAPVNTAGGPSIISPVNVRADADITSRTITSLPAGTPVIILDQQYDSWYHIRIPDGRDGYVVRKYVKTGQ